VGSALTFARAPCPYRKSDPDVLVMQPAEMALCGDPTDALNFARNWVSDKDNERNSLGQSWTN